MKMAKAMLMTILVLRAMLTQATIVNFDLSGSYNYDAYVTGVEMAANGNVRTTLGDHNVQFGLTGYAHLNAPGGVGAGSYKGITNTSVNSGEFELAAGLGAEKFGTASGTVKVNNAIARLGATGGQTATVMLAAAQQGKYSNLNVLVNGDRYYSTTKTGDLSATLEVKYVGDDSWYPVWTETSAVGADGGAFGGQMSGTTYSHQSTAWEAVVVNGASTGGYAKEVGGLTVGASGTDSMWKLATPATLDSNAVLEGFRMITTTFGTAYVNDFILYAASATAVPSASCNLVFDNTPAQFYLTPEVTTNLSFAILNNGTDATNVSVSLSANGSYSWLAVVPATNEISQILNGASAETFFNVTVASNAPGGIYSDAMTLTMRGTGTDAVIKDFSAQISLQVLNNVSASLSKSEFTASGVNGTDTATLTISNSASWELSFNLTNAPADAWLSYPAGILTLPANTATGLTITADGSLAGIGYHSNTLSVVWLNNSSIPNPVDFPIVFAVGGVADLAAFMVELVGDWNSSLSGNINYTLPTPVTAGTAITYNDGFTTPLLTTGQAGTGGTYDGQTLYGAFRQQNNTAAPTNIPYLRASSIDQLNQTADSANAGIAGEFNFVYVFKKADFYKGLDSVSVGFDAASSFSVTTVTWTADSKSLRAVVQNDSTWYISQDQNTIPQAGVKIILTNAADALWAVWNPTVDISAASLDFTTTVAGSTFTNIQAVGIWASLIDGASNPNATISSIQIGGVAVEGTPPPAITPYSITSISLQSAVGGIVAVVGFDGTAGPTYSLQFKTNLVTGADWTNVMTGTASPLIYTNTGSSAAGFYRVQAQ